MPNDADRAGTPAGVFGAELRFYRTRAGLSQKDLAARATVSHDVISKIETGERPPAEDFPPRLDAVPELDTSGALTRLWEHLKKGQKQRLYGWFQEWADIEAQATVLRWYEPLVVPGLLQTEDYARAILSARPDGNLDDLDEQVAARRPGWTRAMAQPYRAGSGKRQTGCAVVVMRHQRGAISCTWAMNVVAASSSLWSAFLPPAAHEALSQMPALGERPRAFRNASAV
jgi:transcriptional regulator with XRE-family HTH domain